MIKSLNKFSKLIACGALATASFGIAQAEDETVKVGVLHSLSGTMAISETSLRDILLFTFDEINASGGVLGKQIEPVVADGCFGLAGLCRESRAASRSRWSLCDLWLLDICEP
jgi:urea transport system substrate-binding protein